MPTSVHAASTKSTPPPSTTTKSAVFVLLLILGLVSVGLSVMFGIRSITFTEALSALGGATDTAGEAAAWTRIPRTVLALCAGAALATSGVAFQAVTRNPLADPGIFGVLAGASLTVVIGITFSTSVAHCRQCWLRQWAPSQLQCLSTAWDQSATAEPLHSS